MEPILISLLAVFGVYIARRRRRRIAGAGRLKIIAHRGGRDGGRGNSLIAVSRSIREGIKLIEVDVQRVVTGEFVLRHDRYVICRRRRRKVAGLSYRELVKVYRRKGWQLAKLDEVLELIGDQPIKLVLDIKHGWMERELIGYLRNRRALGKIYRFDSHFVGVLTVIKRLYPTAITGLSFPQQRGNMWVYWFSWPVLVPLLLVFKHTYPWYVRWLAGIAQADVIVINFRLVTSRLVKVCHEAGLQVCVFSPTMKHHVRGLVGRGVDIITTDDPVKVKQVLVEMREKER